VPNDDRRTPAEFGFGDLFFRVRDAVIVGDAATGRVVLWNAAASQIFGYAEAEAVGMPLEVLVPKPLRERHRAGLRQFVVAGSGNLIGSGETAQLPARHADGSEIWVELVLTPLERDDRGGPYALALVRDVTARKRAQDELAMFASAVVHDLRNPLHAIISAAEILSDTIAVDAANRAFVEVIERQAQHIEELTTELAEAARIESGVIEPQSGTVDVKSTLDAAVETFARRHAGKIEIRVTTGLTVYADPSHVRRAVSNYISNALAYGRMPIVIDACERDGAVEIHVRDHGTGVPEDFVPHLFDRFTRQDRSPGHGMGLGLAIVRGLANANGGDAWYCGVSDGGTCFAVAFPSAPAR
jgi:PAS domain S-box-containing protein